MNDTFQLDQDGILDRPMPDIEYQAIAWHKPRSKQRNLDLLTPEQIWQASLLAKVGQYLDCRVADNLARCGTEQIFKTCRNCGDWQSLDYHCNIKFCPLCNWRIARQRAEMLRIWTTCIGQPKHVVLTRRNTKQISKERIRQNQKDYAKLRRKKLMEKVLGGCVSTEITNEGRGWHLHLHILCDARFIPADRLAIEWGKLVGQEFAIVKVIDCREKSYLGEVTKYAVKPAELVSWDVPDIIAFINAIKGVRLFATYGTLFKLSKEIKREIAANKPEATPCPCGCSEWIYETEEQDCIRSARYGR